MADAAKETKIQAALLSSLKRVTGRQYTNVPLTMSVNEIGVDSLGLSQVVLHIEEAMGSEIEDAVLTELIEAETIGDFYHALVDQYCGSQPDSVD